MSYLDWHVGMKVVCVDAQDGPIRPNYGSLKAGSVYTISRIEADAFPELAVQVDEVGLNRWEFLRASRFRKVQPRKTDIAVFEAILHGDSVPEDA